MTILIAVAIPDAVVLMADGRHANQIEIINDNAQKIFAIGDQLSVGVCGAVTGTNLAVEDLRGSPLQDPERLADRLANLSYDCVNHVLSSLTPAAPALVNLRVGLIAGGFAGGQSFLASGLFSLGMTVPDRQLRFPTASVPQAMVVGGEAARAPQFFYDRLRETIVQRAEQRPMDSEAWVSAILTSGVETVRFAREHDRSIGGRIHYSVLRRGSPEQVGEA